jgi:hypothetical protein
MNELIEEYLRARGVRYFRGHHDDEYFHLVHTRTARLHVHLEVCGDDRDGVQVSITGDRYYPAGHSEQLQQVIARWNAECHDIGAVAQESSDPHLVGVATGSRYRGMDPGQFGAFVDGCIAAASELFGRIVDLAPTVHQDLRDVG